MPDRRERPKTLEVEAEIEMEMVIVAVCTGITLVRRPEMERDEWYHD